MKKKIIVLSLLFCIAHTLYSALGVDSIIVVIEKKINDDIPMTRSLVSEVEATLDFSIGE